MPRITKRVFQNRPRDRGASMRPGRNAPDNVDASIAAPAGTPSASMRPGRNAPDNPIVEDDGETDEERFNEAGAKCPG